MKKIDIKGINVITIERLNGAENYIEINLYKLTSRQTNKLEELKQEELNSQELIEEMTEIAKPQKQLLYDFDENNNEKEVEEIIEDLKKRFKKELIEVSCNF